MKATQFINLSPPIFRSTKSGTSIFHHSFNPPFEAENCFVVEINGSWVEIYKSNWIVTHDNGLVEIMTDSEFNSKV